MQCTLLALGYLSQGACWARKTCLLLFLWCICLCPAHAFPLSSLQCQSRQNKLFHACQNCLYHSRSNALYAYAPQTCSRSSTAFAQAMLPLLWFLPFRPLPSFPLL